MLSVVGAGRLLLGAKHRGESREGREARRTAAGARHAGRARRAPHGSDRRGEVGERARPRASTRARTAAAAIGGNVSNLPAALPVSQWPPLAVDERVFEVLYFGWKHGSPEETEPGEIRWFAPDSARVAQYDQATDTIYLSTKLAEPGNEAQLVISLGHERAHAAQYRRGELFSCGAAEFMGERLLAKWREHVAELEAKRAAAARPLARPHFLGSALEPTANPRADLALSGRGVRAEFR